MPASPYIVELRALVGPRLLLVPAAAAVVHDEAGRVLLVKTTRGLWSLPAGAVDPGEDPRSAVVREVREETGLEVAPARLLDVVGGQGFRVRYENGDLVEYTVAVFACAIVGGALRTDGVETVDHAWVEPERVPGMVPLPYPAAVFARRG